MLLNGRSQQELKVTSVDLNAEGLQRVEED